MALGMLTTMPLNVATAARYHAAAGGPSKTPTSTSVAPPTTAATRTIRAMLPASQRAAPGRPAPTASPTYRINASEKLAESSVIVAASTNAMKLCRPIPLEPR
jgi:hypothetical protein